jgi:phage terminase large subunit-like protein
VGKLSSISDEFLGGLRKTILRPNINAYQPYDGAQSNFHKSGSLGRIIFGGNRAGKTVAGACESVWWLLGTHPFQKTPPTPVYGRGTAVDIEQGLKKIMLPEIARWLPPSALQNGSWEQSYDKQGRLLTLANGSQMDFLTNEMDAEKHAGTSRNFIWFDEECPQHIFNEDLLRLVDVQGHYWMTMTPVMGMTWVYYQFYEPIVMNGQVNENVKLFEAPTEDNPYLPEGAIDIILEGMDDAEKQARKHGKFIAASGLVYPEFHPSIHCIQPVVPSEIQYQIVSGMDHGLRNPTCWLWAYVDQEGRIIVFHEWYQAEWTVQDHARAINDYESKSGIKDRDGYRVGDPAITQRSGISGGSIQSEYSDRGIYIGLGNNDVHYGINRVRRLIQAAGLYITNDCTNLIQELHSYRWDTYASNRNNANKQPKDQPRKFKDHAVDALRYLVCSRPELEFRGLAGDVYAPFIVPRTTPADTEPIKYEDWGMNDDQPYSVLGDNW